MEVAPWSRAMEKGHLTWSDFMVHGVNLPLDGYIFLYTHFL